MNITMLFYEMSTQYYNALMQNVDLKQLVKSVYLPLNNFENIKLLKENYEVYLWLPGGITVEKRDQVDKKVSAAVAQGINGIVLGGLGDLKYITLYPSLKFVLNYGFNFYNSRTIDVFEGFTCTCSPELDPKTIRTLSGTSLEAVVYGRLQVMTSACCFRSVANKCNHCASSYELEDRKSKRYPVLSGLSGCGSILLGCDVLDIVSDVPQLKNIENFRLEISNEPTDKITRLVKNIRQGMNRYGK